MFPYIWPIILIVFSNTLYQICAKSVPEGLDAFASLSVTYLFGAVLCIVMYHILNKGGSLIKEYQQINWASFALSIAVVGLEVGCIFAYKNGWQVSSMQIVQSAFLAIVLIFVGYGLYKEAISASKIIGIVIILVGLYFINK